MMKAKLKALLLFLGGGLVAVAFLGIPVRTGNGDPVASENGDVNGDGVIDVSDAVYTLLHLFKNGPGPVAIANSPADGLSQEEVQLLKDPRGCWRGHLGLASVGHNSSYRLLLTPLCDGDKGVLV